MPTVRSSFLRDLRVMDYSEPRIYKLLSHLKKIGEEADFPFREADTEDIKDVVAWSMIGIWPRAQSGIIKLF